MCRAQNRSFNPAAGPRWTAWGNSNNARFQDAASARLTAADVPRLKLKWAFAFPGNLQSYSQATLAAGRLFVGSWGGKVYSLDASSGCVHWFFDAGSGVRSAISIAESGSRHIAVFGDMAANVFALDAVTGQLIWRIKVDDFPLARVSASPTVYNGRIYVGVASGEEGAAAVPTYECCRFRGSMLALDVATGKQIWKTFLIPDAPTPTKKNAAGAQLWGPSGVPVWGTAVVDARRNALYVTTGNNYSDPTTTLSDAFVALDLASGKILWSRQMTTSDAYTAACRLPDKTNCAVSNGPDLDFGASPILVTQPNGRRLLLAGQKSGIVHALDPDANGEVLWQTRIGRGGTMGGIQWGSATDGTNIYVALSDIGRIMLTYSASTDADPKQGGGMFALRLSDGERVWYTPPPGCGTRPRCSPAQSAAVSASPGVAFSGSVDGHMRAYSAGERVDHLGLRHHPRIPDRQWRSRPRRIHRRPRSGDRRWNGLRQFRLSHRRRHARQCAAGLFSGREIVVRYFAGSHFAATIVTDSTLRVGPEAVDPGAAFAAPLRDALLPWTIPTMRT